MSTRVPALKLDSPWAALPPAQAALTSAWLPQRGISANRVHNLSALNAEAAIFQSS